jgi:GDP-mannose 6-dehydrogenase
MRVSIFGLGYVGVVTAACLARDGHDVLGVDVNAEKVAAIAAGRSPIVEPGLAGLLADGVAAGRICATTSAEEAVSTTDVSLVSVGTPAAGRGAPLLDYVEHVSEQIGKAVAVKGSSHVMILRSTVPPGTLRRCRGIVDGCSNGTRVHFAFNPEFLREGSAVADFDNPCYTVIGTDSPEAESAVRTLYASVDAPVIVVAPEVSEMVKYVANSWHAVKIGFANEVGRMAKAFGVDGREVMDLIIQDSKLNVSPAYMRPGFAYGGSCLPKDVNALLFYAQELGIDLPMLSGLPVSNQAHIGSAVDLVLKTKPRRVTIFGLAFKPLTDDLRESPAVPLAKRLLGEGCELRIYSPDVNKAMLMGTNLVYIREHLPHFENLLVDDPIEAVEWAEVVVVTHPQRQFDEPLAQVPAGKRIIDLAGTVKVVPDGVDYDGIAW